MLTNTSSYFGGAVETDTGTVSLVESVVDGNTATQSGGGHYKIDPTMTTAMQSNEIWLSLMTDATGAGMQMVSITNHLARPEAASIVIHDTDTAGTRLACIDLK